MPRMMLLLWSVLFALVAGHSFMIRPRSDNKLVAKRHCRRGPLRTDNCAGPCIAMTSWQYNASAPVTTWKRGSKQRVLWAMNKHHHGFVRLALVPVAQRDSFQAHEKHAFHYTCFETGARKCDSAKYFCGTGGQLYETKIKVPRVKDGLYVLGWAWYGSYAMKGGKVDFHFGDYYSCAYVRIKGGKKAKKKVRKPSNKKKRCRAMTNTRGVCEIEPCPNAYGAGAEPGWMCPKGMTWKKTKCRWSKKGEKWTTKREQSKKEQQKKRKKQKKKQKQKKKRKSRNEKRKASKEKTKEKKKRKKSGKQKKSERKMKEEQGARKNSGKRNKTEKSTKACQCNTRTGSAKEPYVAGLLISRLDVKGRRESTKCFCGGEVRLSDYPDGFTIIADVVGDAPAVRFVVNNIIIRTERVAPFSIRGDSDDKFSRWSPPMGRKVRIEALVNRHRYHVNGRFVWQ